MDVGQAAVDTVVTERQLRVVDPEEVQDRGVDVIDRRRMVAVERLVAPRIALAADDPATILHLLGIDHTKLTFRHNGVDRRLTDVHGELITGLLA